MTQMKVASSEHLSVGIVVAGTDDKTWFDPQRNQSAGPQGVERPKFIESLNSKRIPAGMLLTEVDLMRYRKGTEGQRKSRRDTRVVLAMSVQADKLQPEGRNSHNCGRRDAY
jgi:hypothetical protein